MNVSVCTFTQIDRYIDYLEGGHGGDVLDAALLIFQVVSLRPFVSFTHLPQLNGLIWREKKEAIKQSDKNIDNLEV